MSKDAYKYVMTKYAGFGGIFKDLGSVKSGLDIMSTAGIAISQIIQKLQNDTRRKALLEDLAMNDPIIKSIPKDQLLEWYATIYRVAPSLSVDKAVVKEILQNFARFGKVDINTIKNLADTQKSMADLDGKNTGFIRSIIGY